MPWLLPTAAAVVVLSAAATVAAQPVLTPTWSRAIEKDDQLLGVEERGRCLVAKVGDVIQVLQPTGALWWSWPYRKVSRFIEPTTAAISPACDAIAIPGQPGYKYSWIVQRGGRAVAVETSSVPAGAAFDRTGALVAVGTSGGTLSLYSRAGELRWKRDVRDALVLRELEFTDDNRRIVSKGWAGPAVVEIDGNVVWGTLATHLSVSRDLSTLVFGNAPNHGPGISEFTVTDANRESLWSRLGWTTTFVSATGHRILAKVSARQDISDAYFKGQSNSVVQLLTREGDVVTAYPEYGEPIALSDDGQRMWLRSKERFDCVDDRGTVLATISIDVGQRPGDQDRPWFQTFVARGFEQIVIQTTYRGSTLARYAVPAECRN